jgi:DNA repair protein RecO (recombination protein O)
VLQAEVAAAALPASTRVLIPGCGTAYDARALSPFFPAGSITGVDCCAAAIEKARAECAGVHPLPGPAMMSCWYMNELMFRLLPREDPHPGLFDAYVIALQQLAAGQTAAGALRKFEWTLLKETGYGLDQEPPDFDDAQQEPQLRARLRERLAEHLAGRPLATRQVLLALQRYQGNK